MNEKAQSTLYTIQWEKFRDPIKRMLDKGKFKQEVEFEEQNEFAGHDMYTGPVIQTDFGIFPINNGGLMSTQFNLWVGHTNFPLSQKHGYILDTTPGVEIIMVKTPYRFIVGVARLFSENDVLNRLKNNLIKSMINVDFSSKLGNLKESLSKQYKFFAIIIFQGKKHVLHGLSVEEVETQVKNFTEKNGAQEIEYSYKN